MQSQRTHLSAFKPNIRPVGEHARVKDVGRSRSVRLIGSVTSAGPVRCVGLRARAAAAEPSRPGRVRSFGTDLNATPYQSVACCRHSNAYPPRAKRDPLSFLPFCGRRGAVCGPDREHTPPKKEKEADPDVPLRDDGQQ